MQTRISVPLFMAVAVCGLSHQASAQEYCVTCIEPNAKYRCAIEGEASFAAKTSRGQLLCISELARLGGHGSCSVGRSAAEELCDGELRTVMFPSNPESLPPPLAQPLQGQAIPEGQGVPLQAPEQAPAQAPEQAIGQPEGQPEPPAEGPPQTVEELAKQTVDASEKGLKKAGQAVGDTAKSTGQAVGNALSKTWKCVTSLFGDC